MIYVKGYIMLQFITYDGQNYEIHQNGVMLIYLIEKEEMKKFTRKLIKEFGWKVNEKSFSS